MAVLEANHSLTNTQASHKVLDKYFLQVCVQDNGFLMLMFER